MAISRILFGRSASLAATALASAGVLATALPASAQLKLPKQGLQHKPTLTATSTEGALNRPMTCPTYAEELRDMKKLTEDQKLLLQDYLDSQFRSNPDPQQHVARVSSFLTDLNSSYDSFAGRVNQELIQLQQNSQGGLYGTSPNGQRTRCETGERNLNEILGEIPLQRSVIINTGCVVPPKESVIARTKRQETCDAFVRDAYQAYSARHPEAAAIGGPE
jgi:hypothetical protein